MTTPMFAALDGDTQDTLSLIADDPRVADDYARFLDACQAVGEHSMGSLVSVNVVRALLTNAHGDLTIHPQRLSAFWNKATGEGKPMRRTGDWQVCEGSGSGNDGRPQPVRRWVG